MNKKELAKALNISRQALDKKLQKYDDELKSFIVTDKNGRFIDFDVNGVEVLRGLHYVKKSQPDKEVIDNLKQENMGLHHQIELLSLELKYSNLMLEKYEEENANLKDQCNAFNKNWLIRLLAKPKY